MSAPISDSTGTQSQAYPSYNDTADKAQQEQQQQDASVDNKPIRLTEEEKKRNHVASEHKRRQGIREGFDRLAGLVPGLDGYARSEGLVISGTVAYMEDQLLLNKKLREDIERHGGKVEDPPRPEATKAEERKINKSEEEDDE